MSTNLVQASIRSIAGELTVGPVGFGCWRMTTGSDAENEALVSAALEQGMNLVDTADVYGLDWNGSGFGACEEALGRVFARNSSLRDRIVLAGKAGIIPGVPYDSSATHLVAACEASLRRMGVEHVDIFQIHRPDHFTHPEEIAGAFTTLRDRGLARFFGVSNHTPEQTRALSAFVGDSLVSTQPEFSCLELGPMRDGTLDNSMAQGLTPLAWSPLAGGRLATGDGVSPELLSVLDEIALRERVTRAAIAVAFVFAHPSRPVALVGTQQAGRLVELSAATKVSLSRTDVYRIVQASDGRPLP